jgi:DNA-binding FrmR family transcriptional regulator
MNHVHKNKEDVLKRLKIIEGHLKKIISMVESDSYCVDVLQQSSAVRSALKKTQDIILTNHMETCVMASLKEEGKEKVISELVSIYNTK